METVRPKRVLDIGIGSGFYGAAIWNYSKVLLPAIPQIFGIEPWEDYKNPMWDLYTGIDHVPLQTYTSHIKYDLIIMMDVIEHLDDDEAEIQVKRYMNMLAPGGSFIISTPAIFVAQGAWGGNKFEIHKSLWTHEKFKAAGFTPVRPPQASLFGEQMLIYRYKQEVKQ